MYVYIQTYFNLKLSDSEVSKHLLVSQSDSEGSKISRVILRPVLLTFNLFTLLDVSYHDNNMCMFLPYHPPVINKCIPDWTCENKVNKNLQLFIITWSFLDVVIVFTLTSNNLVFISIPLNMITDMLAPHEHMYIKLGLFGYTFCISNFCKQ